jgi:ATP-binding cassette subfamily B protein
MKYLASLNKYFIKYKWRFLLGLLFVTIANLLAVIPPVVVRHVLDDVSEDVESYSLIRHTGVAGQVQSYIFTAVLWSGLLLLGLALLRGIFMFFMRQTIIVMSRHIEFDQKNEIYRHYQKLSTRFYKSNFTGDLMNRISEDVSRVRMYTGPAIMYATNVIVLIIMSVWGMLRVNPKLTLYVVIPLPLLAVSIYYVNKIIYRKSRKIQAQLSALTTTAQESYAANRVIKSFVQEENRRSHFNETSEAYRKSSINLSLTEAIYAPAMNVFTGLSMLSTILIGGYLAIQGEISVGNIAEFVLYINLLLYPVGSIGMIASMVQRAGASQQRIDEFLKQEPDIVSPMLPIQHTLQGAIHFEQVSFTYPQTGIKALKKFSLKIIPAQKIAIMGKTGSGKSTLAHLLLRMYDIQDGALLLDNMPIQKYGLQDLRRQIGYAPQDTFLFSDTVFNNIKFGQDAATDEEVREAARLADLEKDIYTFANGYETLIGERGVMLSGGQKQRIVLARALLKKAPILLLDECLSAVDTRTEQTILHNLKACLQQTTTLVITHRIFTSWDFDKIIVLDNGSIAEQGTHHELMQLNGRYAKLYRHQTETALIEN